MRNRFAEDVRRAVVRAAEREAQAAGVRAVEAEHLLLALAAEEESPVGRLLAESGLDHDGVRAALEREAERSLAAVGVALSDFRLAGAPTPPRGRPRFAASAKRALERTARVAVARGDRTISAPCLLVGILRADVGTVPRALAAADIDRVALSTRAERLLG